MISLKSGLFFIAGVIRSNDARMNYQTWTVDGGLAVSNFSVYEVEFVDNNIF